MKRNIISAILAVLLCLGLVFSVSAATNPVDFVVDEIGYLEADEIDQLNEQAAEIYNQRKVGIFFVYTTAPVLKDFDFSQLIGDMEDYYIMIENDESWYSFLGGKAESVIDLDTEDDLRDIYVQTDTYVSGVSEFLAAAAECFPVVAVEAPVESAPAESTPVVGSDAVLDGADILSAAEEAELTKKLQGVSDAYNTQIVVATIASLDGGDIDVFLERLYDESGFGYGANHDGVLLLVCMDPREYRILSNGFANEAIKGDEIDAIGDAIVSDLSDGNYEAAFLEFADQCAYYLDGQVNGFPFNFGKNLLISVVIGLVVGLIVALILRGQLKSVYKRDQANAYVKPGSMNVTVHRDIFLYRKVTRTKKSSSSSSSGSSRSTGGGSF